MSSIDFELLALKESEVTIDVNINEEYIDQNYPLPGEDIHSACLNPLMMYIVYLYVLIR